MLWVWGILALLALVAVYDLVQTKHAILRSFPIIGHFRYILESVGPELTRLSHSCGVDHPGLLSSDHMEILDGAFGGRPLREVFGYQAGWELPSEADAARVRSVMVGH